MKSLINLKFIIKTQLLVLFLLLAPIKKVNSQIFEPVKWSTSVEKISEKEYNLVAIAVIESGWNIYSQKVAKGGPIPTTFFFNEKDGYTLSGKTIEEKGHTKMDPTFNIEVKSFSNKAKFVQRVKLINDKKTIDASVEFMVCMDTRCLPPKEVDLIFDLTKAKKVVTKKVSSSKKNVSKKGLLAIFFIAFLSGFAALLTPCVFPMIPMTVSFFTKQSKNKSQGIRNAIIFGVSIVVIYVGMGLLVSFTGESDSLNSLSTNVWFNLVFFLLLVVFAVSFLGAFELTLPSSWSTKIDAQADRGGLTGIFFMALALAIVSFSCTGPIVGTLLVEAATKGGIAPVVGMLGFSSAIALPFTLFAIFPGWMNSLPKSGGWLNTVKVVLGFLELALAFKFLSNADMVLDLHLLEREVFLAIWIAIFAALSLYLFGKIQLPHDSPLKHISVGRLSLGLLSLGFTVYMLPGLWGAPLNLISAFPPPQDYSESPYGVGYQKLATIKNVVTNSESSKTSHSGLPDGAHMKPPYDILVFNDYDKGLAYAKEVNKPVLIDFTGKACVNCRKMEQNVWAKDKVLSVLKNDVVLISLYVDDKRALEEDEVVESKLRPGKKLRYIGQKWSELQTIKYKTNSQPYYVLIDAKGENLIDPVAYTPNVDEYHNWLKTGIAAYK
ncbi:Thiol:disulfide interchange protein DsbD [Tenacibaculum sp. MAR_2010_89]|uniref:protein-disulfide reductase DsbD family protein n=1 Tax=Tenacibaculum sp. MAR_2010_89 TaxID=1250198 RepID=UPI00089821A3|nr:Thiol:disulfide interchange protein DsbD [Tenacibaculum sp. MAR_2010_89]